MNKILFKLIEGKGKFFLGRNWPVWNPEKCHTNLQCESESERSKEQFCGCWNEYNRAINECISEALKNGEIVNPEVIAVNMGLQYGLGRPLEDGDTFDLPEGMGFEKKCTRCGCTEPGMSDLLCCSTANYQKVLLILPEKPVQKEESHIDLWKEGEEFYNKSYSGTPK